MNVYVSQLKESIREKLDHIDDAEYLSSLDAILTYETYGSEKRAAKEAKPAEGRKKPLWKKLGFL